MAASPARLRGMLAGLPLTGAVSRALNVGCGAYPSARTLREALPGWTLYGLDLDGTALRRARLHAPFLGLLQADARALPGLFRAQFGLVLLRHPDLFRHRAPWSQIIPGLPALLAPGGCLLVTLYAPEEVEWLYTLDLPPVYPLDEHRLPPVDLTGQDRFGLVYRAR